MDSLTLSGIPKESVKYVLQMPGFTTVKILKSRKGVVWWRARGSLNHVSQSSARIEILEIFFIDLLNTIEGRSQHVPPTHHKLDSRKVELIPAKILDCSQRDPENGSRILKVKIPENNPVSIFNLRLVIELRKFRKNQGVKKVITEIISKAIRTENLSLLSVLPRLVEIFF